MPARDFVMPAPGSEPTDCELLGWNLHHLVTIGVRDADRRDIAAVARQLGPPDALLTQEPDLTIRFVERTAGGAPLTFVGHDDAAFEDGDFMLMRGRHKTRVRERVRLDLLKPGFEIVCEHGAAAVPLFVPILNIVALSKGLLPLHASAFVHEGVGIVTTGWSRAGKTDTLLGFARCGATYVGDDWVYLTEDGRRVYGLPEPVRLWDWQLRAAPEFLGAISVGDRMRLRTLRLLRPATSLLPTTDGFRNRVVDLVDRHMGVEVPAKRLFGSDHVAHDCSFDVLLLTVVHDSSAIVIEPIDPLEVAIRVTFSLRYERRRLEDAYQKFRFAFPWRASALLERAESIERRLLRRAFAGKPAYVVRHPFRAPIDELAEAAAAYCRIDSPAKEQRTQPLVASSSRERRHP